MISSFSVSSHGDRPSESISLSFTKVLTSFRPQDAEGKSGNPEHLTYDVAAAKVV